MNVPRNVDAPLFNAYKPKRERYYKGVPLMPSLGLEEDKKRTDRDLKRQRFARQRRLKKNI